MSIEQLQQAINLADQYDFIIASDECYSEVYLDEENPPPGILEACAAMGRMTTAAASLFTVSQNAQIYPAYAQDLSPVTPVCCVISCATAPITAAPCP